MTKARTFALGITCVVFLSGCPFSKKKNGDDAGVVALADPAASVAPPVTPVATASAPAKVAFPIGSKGQVLWKGRYYAASIIGIVGPDNYRVHYTGYESSWDEVVGLSRMKGFGAAPATAAAGGGGGGGGAARTGGGNAAAAADGPCPGPGLTRRCGGRCVNIQTDDHNCGSCGTVCSGGKHCDGHMSCRDSAGNL